MDYITLEEKEIFIKIKIRKFQEFLLELFFKKRKDFLFTDNGFFIDRKFFMRSPLGKDFIKHVVSEKIAIYIFDLDLLFFQTIKMKKNKKIYLDSEKTPHGNLSSILNGLTNFCIDCETSFCPQSNRQKYCKNCSKIHEKNNNKEYARKKYKRKKAKNANNTQ